MIGRLRLFPIVGSGGKRLFLVLLVVAFLIVALIPRQAQVILQSVGKPFANVLAVPFKAMAGLDRGIRDWWNQYLALQGVYEQNIHLQKEIQRLQGEMNQLREKALASDRLADLLNFHQHGQFQTVAARVVGRNASNWYQALILDKGEDDGIRVEMGVMTPAGVVGQVIKTSGSMSIALLLTDPNVAVTGLVQRTRDGGIIQGTAKGFLRMKYIPPLSPVQKGDLVVTSGLTGGFPRGLLVGRVVQVEESEDDLFQSAHIDPVVDFSKLEEVLVLLSIQPEDGIETKVKELDSPVHRSGLP